MSHHRRRRPKDTKCHEATEERRKIDLKLLEPDPAKNPVVGKKAKKKKWELWTDRVYFYRKEKRADHVISRHKTETAATQAYESQLRKQTTDLQTWSRNREWVDQRKADRYWIEEAA